MKCNVLIVDDSKILRSAIRKVVQLAGVDEARIYEAGDGQEALDLLKNEWIDLVLLDLNMPVMDGEQFAAEVRKNEELKDLTIVVVSTESNQDRMGRMRDLGVVASLRKPFEPEDLCKLISDQLGIAA